MAHEAQRQWFKAVKLLYPERFENVNVLDVGSLDINGSCREHFTGGSYLGIDVEEGKGVDLICMGQDFMAPDNTYDVVVSGECFEHNPFWKETFVNMHRVCRVEGLIMMTCATDPRPEHGTLRAAPYASTKVAASWNYYKNLDVHDFEDNFHMKGMFSHYNFSKNTVGHDLYFFGFKQGKIS